MDSYILEHLKCVICTEYHAENMQCYHGHSHCKACLREYEFHNIHTRGKKELKCSVY